MYFQVCQLVSCLLDAVPLESYIDTTLEHLPNLFLHIVNQLCCCDTVFTPRQLVMCLQLCSKVLSRVQPQPSASKSNGLTDSTRPRSKTVSFSQRRNSDSSLTLTLEGMADRLKDLSRSDHHLDSDSTLKIEMTNRSASVGARLEADQSVNVQLCNTKRLAELASDPKSECLNFTPNLMLEECRKKYEELFLLLITSDKMIDWRSHHYSDLFKQLIIISCSDVEKNDSSGLEQLLQACLSSSQAQYDSDQLLLKPEIKLTKYSSWKDAGVLDMTVHLEAQSSDWEEVFCAACALLVDLSTFPSFCQPSLAASPSSRSEMPSWLQLLTVCCCWLGQSPSMQLAAISTLLDLIAVASKSSIPVVASTESDQVTHVVLTPLLLPEEVQTLENSTCAMQVCQQLSTIFCAS